MATITEDFLKDKIHAIRGVQVMLDCDLAEIYGYETRYFNRQVNNNLSRFDNDFRFQLSESEFSNLMCKNYTSRWGGTRKLPYAFTEQGIYMLMTVLKGDLAVQQSKALIRLFKQMKDYILLRQNMLPNSEFADFQREYPNVDISLKVAGGIYHDRYIIIDHNTKDEAIYHCGGSSKDGGKRITSITKVSDMMLYQNIIDDLQDNPPLLLGSQN